MANLAFRFTVLLQLLFIKNDYKPKLTRTNVKHPGMQGKQVKVAILVTALLTWVRDQ